MTCAGILRYLEADLSILMCKERFRKNIFVTNLGVFSEPIIWNMGEFKGLFLH
jgi:hypothetical protein